MPAIYRPRYTRPLPSHAELYRSGAKQCARWKTRAGKTITGLVLPGGRVRVESAKWWIRYRDHAGQLQQVPGFTDKAATRAFAAELERRADRVKAGLESPAPAASPLPLAQLADLFRDSLTAMDRDDFHVQQTRRRLQHALDGLALGALFPAQVDGREVARWLSAERGRRKWSARSFNLYAGTLRQFGRWLVREGHSAGNPFESIRLVNAEAGRTVERRALGAAELRKLIGTTEAGPARFGISGPDRVMLYTLAAFTGCRIGELSTLTPESFHLDKKLPISVTVKARRSKRRKADTIPVPKSIRAQLGAWLKTRTPGKPIIQGWGGEYGWWTRGARMVRADLEAAGLHYADAAGAVFDFHALRVQFVTALARAGVGLVEAQRLARHSTPALTANVYTKVRPELADAADRLKL